MDKILSIRPNGQISTLFAKIQHYQESANRTEIVNRALDKALESKIDWRAISKLKIKENADESKQPDFMQIRVEESKYNAVYDKIKEAFDLERVTAPYLIRLVLTNYLSSLKNKVGIICTTERMVDFGIDSLVFKKEYDNSDYPQKEILLNLCRIYLENCNSHINDSIRKQVNQKIKAYSDYFNICRYFPLRRSTLGTCNIIFVSKVLAGLFLIVAEIDGYNLDEVVEVLQQEISSKN